ncbi:MAG TPA: TIGR03560 family F420-dependent LLM class oxidoreductase [Actinomycetota bacterium]|nr:TIGR03560 family F420-dependent LLM class oxidoreductase [Actinomycetota bacterium]
MEFGLDVSQHRLSWDEIVDRARFAEEVGFDGVWVFDHFTPLYGRGPGPCLEAWTLLAALGAATERIRLGPLVTGITYRHPSLLATEAVTADHVSGGRIELAVGAAWHEAEHRALGMDFPPTAERVRRLEEAIQVIELLMTTDGASFEGRYYRLDGATYNPRPVQKPRPPLWIGGGGEKLMLPLIARRADVWHGFGSPSTFARKSRLLDELAQKANRDPASIRRSTGLSLSEPWAQVRATVEELAAIGVSYLTVSWPSEGRKRLEEFVERVMPELRALEPEPR